MIFAFMTRTQSSSCSLNSCECTHMMILARNRERLRISTQRSKQGLDTRTQKTNLTLLLFFFLIFKYVLSLESPFCGRYNAFSESGYCIVFSLFFIENHSRKTRERGSCFQYSLLKSQSFKLSFHCNLASQPLSLLLHRKQ